MNDIWIYWRRWAKLILLGLVLGALVVLVFYIQQEPTEYNATADVLVGETFSFLVVSSTRSSSQAAVEDIVELTYLLQGFTENPVTIGSVAVEGRHKTVGWKLFVFGSVVGGLLAVGAGYLWDEAVASRVRLRVHS